MCTQETDRNLRRLSHGLLLAGASILSLSGAPAMAQSAPAPAPVPVPVTTTPPESETPATNNDIVVTGSRIRNPTLTSPSPLQAITAEAIQNSGATNVQEVLSEIPAVGIPGNTRVTNAADTSPGLATVNLRNLGDTRTLVLIDGRRTVAGVPGTAQVDLTMIPSSFVERVDVLTGGASAVYGSDALAGVVNFIYKKKFSGLLANAQAGQSEVGDDKRYSLDATFGQNFMDNRGNVMVFAGYNHEGAVNNINRARTARGFSSIGNLLRTNGNNDQNLTAAQRLFDPYYSPSNVGPGGTFTFGGRGSQLILSDGSIVTYPSITAATFLNPTAQSSIDTLAAVQKYGYNANAVGQQASPSDQLTVATRLNFDVTPALNLFAESTFSNYKTVGKREASPMRTDSALGAFTGSNGFYPIQFQVFNNSTQAFQTVNNPFVPAAVLAAATDSFTGNDVPGLASKDISFLVRTVTFGNGTRSTPTERDNFRVAFGGTYKIGGDWTADASYQYGYSKQRQGMTGLADLNRLAQAVQVIPDINDVDNDGNRTEAICFDPTARAQGCVPINVYGNADGQTRITTEAANWLSTELSRYSKQAMQSAALNVGGTLFNLPAGPAQISVGAEWRKETSLDDFDPLTNAARNGYVQLLDTRGKFSVKEAYGEVILPLIHNTPFIENLTLRGAARISDYSTVGSFPAWNIGAEWSPISDIRFRAVYAHAVRAPNINELYAANAAGITTINDPCQGVTLTDASPTAVNCRLNPSIVANINQNGRVVLTSSDQAGVGTITGGNRNLNEETGKTLTLGVVVNPRSIDFLRNFTFTADYFDVKIEDAINRPSAAVILNKCYVTGLPNFCSLITRRTAPSGAFSIGSVEQVAIGLVNSGGLFARGLDFTASYNHALVGGTATVSGSWTHLLKQGVITFTGDPYDNQMGEIGRPKDSANVNLNWENRQFGFTIENEYVGKQMFDYENYQTGFKLANGSLPDRKYFTIDSKIYTNAQVRFTGLEHFELFAGVKNMFDVEAPFLWSGTPNGSPNAIWDIIGRRYYAGVRAKF
ncbi:TonB-dependent receptor domain-containing protein [Sphingomonas humi]